MPAGVDLRHEVASLLRSYGLAGDVDGDPEATEALDDCAGACTALVETLARSMLEDVGRRYLGDPNAEALYVEPEDLLVAFPFSHFVRADFHARTEAYGYIRQLEVFSQFSGVLAAPSKLDAAKAFVHGSIQVQRLMGNQKAR